MWVYLPARTPISSRLKSIDLGIYFDRLLFASNVINVSWGFLTEKYNLEFPSATGGWTECFEYNNGLNSSGVLVQQKCWNAEMSECVNGRDVNRDIRLKGRLNTGNHEFLCI